MDICPDGTGPLWNASLSWATSRPSLSPCFRQTLLVWVPCAGSLLLSSLGLPSLLLGAQRRRLIWTLSGLARVVFPLLALLVICAQVVRELVSGQAGSWGLLSSRLLLIISLGAFCSLLAGELSTGGALSPYISFFALLPLLIYAGLEAAAAALEDWGSPESACALSVAGLLSLCFLCLAFRLESEETRDAEELASPELHRSALNKLSLDWMTPLVRLGFQRPLLQGEAVQQTTTSGVAQTTSGIRSIPDDLWKVPPDFASTQAHGQLEANLEREFGPVIEALRLGRPGASAWMTRVIARTYGWELFTSGLLNLVVELVEFMEPLFLKFMISYAADPLEPSWHGLVYVGGIVLAMLVRNVSTQHYYLIQAKMGMKFKTAFISAVYRKALRTAPAARAKFSVGEVVNLMSVDAARMSDVADVVHMIWACPLQITIAILFLYNVIGVAAFAGAAVYLSVVPFNAVLSHYFDKYQEKQMEEKDARIKLLTELLNGIKLLKLYAWEPAFERQVDGIRAREVGWLKRNAIIGGVLEFAWSCSTIVAAAATFITFVLLGNQVTAEKIFVAYSLFDKVNMPISILPMAISYILMLAVSLRRLSAFFAAGELQEGAVQILPPGGTPVELVNASFSWGKGSRPPSNSLSEKKEDGSEDEAEADAPEAVPTETPLVLRDISLKAAPGALIGVVGRVGAGKSSLLSALCGELERTTGEARLSGEVAYVPQTAWIQNMTLRDNILFGEEFDAERYKKVLSACALGPDLEILQHGDQTEIGERGINLSGGQKARVSLARAVYRRSAAVFLLDDPLSALDVHVGKHIFNELLGPAGLLKDKSRILVTHSLWVLASCDWVVCLGDGEVKEQGAYGYLLSRNGDFAALIRDFLDSAPDSVIEELDEAVLSQLSSSPTLRESLQKRRSRMASQQSQEPGGSTPASTDVVLDRLASATSSPYGSPGKRLSTEAAPSPLALSRATSAKADELQTSDKAKLIDEEEVQVGRVGWAVYASYIREGGAWFVVYLLCMFVGEGLCWTGATLWLQIWADGSAHTTANGTLVNGTISPYEGVGVFAGFAGGNALCAIVLRMCFAVGYIRASRNIHDKLVAAIFRAPMAFFDGTPTGRIVNRCGKDLESVDDQLPGAFDAAMVCCLWTVETTILVCYALPLFAVALVPILTLYILILCYYVATSRQLRRLQSVSQSPVYSSFQETLQGASSIRAYGAVERFVGQTERLVDENNRAAYCNIAANRWLGFRLSLISTGLVLAAGGLILYARVAGGGISAGVAALGLANALQFMGILSYGVRQIARLETEIVAVERIREYSHTKPEADWDTPKGALPPPEDWPGSGAISFDDFGLRYRPGLDLALRGVNCDIRGGEKMGIVGRTGAGKSSLAAGLFRLIESAQGEIRVDGQPIQLLGLHRLRNGLAIIPQDPLVFSGSLRLNLDPFEAHTDGELWRSLELCHLKDFVQGLPQGLTHEVSEGGSDLSLGQRQLLCLGRALLRNARILVLDEATGAVDVETDALVQATLRSAFPAATILTIAHRLGTILDSDRIMVLEAGKVVELDSPSNLLKRPESRFAGMVKDAGLEASKRE